jgi:aspartate aminotransferase
MRLSHLAHLLEGSPILELSNAAKDRMKQGKTLFNYTVGDFDPSVFPIPIELKKEVMKAYAEDYTNYPLAEGNLDLREAICLFEKEWNGIYAKPEEILVGSGGRPLIYAAYRTICDRADKVIYAVPSWNNLYYTQLTATHSVVLHTRPEDGFMPTAQAIRPYLHDATLLCLCSPQNPTGTVFTQDALLSICRMVVEENANRRKTEKKLYILFDAMYGSLTRKFFPHVHPVGVCPEVRPYVIYINAISKIFAATGLRVGWCIGPAPVISKAKNILSHMGAWAPMAEQKAVTRILPQRRVLTTYLKTFKRELSYRLRMIHKGVRKLKNDGYPVDVIEPQGGIYLSLKIDLIGKKANDKTIETAHDVAAWLLEMSGIAILPFSAFGASPALPWFRMSVGTCQKADITPMLSQLKNALKDFKNPAMQNKPAPVPCEQVHT